MPSTNERFSFFPPLSLRTLLQHWVPYQVTRVVPYQAVKVRQGSQSTQHHAAECWLLQQSGPVCFELLTWILLATLWRLQVTNLNILWLDCSRNGFQHIHTTCLSVSSVTCWPAWHVSIQGYPMPGCSHLVGVHGRAAEGAYLLYSLGFRTR